MSRLEAHQSISPRSDYAADSHWAGGNHLLQEWVAEVTWVGHGVATCMIERRLGCSLCARTFRGTAACSVQGFRVLGQGRFLASRFPTSCSIAIVVIIESQTWKNDGNPVVQCRCGDCRQPEPHSPVSRAHGSRPIRSLRPKSSAFVLKSNISRVCPLFPCTVFRIVCNTI